MIEGSDYTDPMTETVTSCDGTYECAGTNGQFTASVNGCVLDIVAECETPAGPESYNISWTVSLNSVVLASGSAAYDADTITLDVVGVTVDCDCEFSEGITTFTILWTHTNCIDPADYYAENGGGMAIRRRQEVTALATGFCDWVPTLEGGYSASAPPFTAHYNASIDEWVLHYTPFGESFTFHVDIFYEYTGSGFQWQVTVTGGTSDLNFFGVTPSIGGSEPPNYGSPVSISASCGGTDMTCHIDPTSLNGTPLMSGVVHALSGDLPFSFTVGGGGSGGGGGPNLGCTCSSSSLRYRKKAKIVQEDEDLPLFPDFVFEPISSPDGQFVFALGSTCSVPCQTVTVTLTSEACCLELDEGTVYNVGSGNVCASVSGGGGTDPYTTCGTISVMVNGTPDCAYVPDGGTVSVSITSQFGDCCPCCQISGPTCGGTAMRQKAAVYRRQMAINKGRRNGVLMNKNAVRNIKLRLTRSKTTSAPQPASR